MGRIGMPVVNRLTFLIHLPLAAALLCCLCSPAVAEILCPIITVDENGNGTLDFSAGCGSGRVFASPGVLAADPGPGGLSSVMTYSLLSPPSLVAGDVLLQD